MTEIKFRTPEVIAAEEQARKAALKQAFATDKPVPAPPAAPAPVPKWNEVEVPALTPVTPVPVAPSAPVATPPVAIDESSAIAPVNVSISISVPSFTMPKLSPEQIARLKSIALKLQKRAVTGLRAVQPHLKQLSTKAQSKARTMPKRQAMITGGGAVLAISLVIGGAQLWQSHTASRQAALKAAAAAKVTSGKVTLKPKFAPVTPATKTELAAGKAGETSYDTKHDTFSYADKLSGQPLTVSQQPLPDKFKSAEEAVTTIAKDIRATQPILTKQGTAYAMTDPKSNAQTIVYSLNNLLIFINSPFTHQSNEWVQYLNNLKQN